MMQHETKPDLTDWFAQHGLSSRATCRRAQLDLAHRDRRIFSVEGDLAMPSIPFDQEIPDRYLQMGIAEANIVGMSAGLAMRGKVPFVNSFAAFLSLRACEQVRVDVAYSRANVKLIGSYAGISGGAAGPTHHCCEDMAVLRAMPNMTILSPADAYETYKATLAAAAYDGPIYMRVGRADTPQVYQRDYDFVIGRAVQLAEGTDLTLIATGNQMLFEALQAANLLRAEQISCRVLNIHTIKPLDRDAVLAAALETGAIVTAEDHSIMGGLGSAVAELLMGTAPVPVVRVGIRDQFCERVGTFEEMLPVYGLDGVSIAMAARQALALKVASHRKVRLA